MRNFDIYATESMIFSDFEPQYFVDKTEDRIKKIC